MKKFTWLWKKFWGRSFKIHYPDGTKKYILLHRRTFYSINEWNNYFKKRKGESENQK